MAANEPDPGPAHGFSKKDAGRIAATVNRDELRARNELPGRSKDGSFPPALLIPAVTKSGGISAGSTASPSTNTVTLMIPNGGGPGLTSGGDVAVYNYSTRTMTGANKLIYLGFFNGSYVIPLADC